MIVWCGPEKWVDETTTNVMEGKKNSHYGINWSLYATRCLDDDGDAGNDSVDDDDGNDDDKIDCNGGDGDDGEMTWEAIEWMVEYNNV